MSILTQKTNIRVGPDFGGQITLDEAKQRVLAVTGQTEYDKAKVLKFVNEQRTKLGGTEIDELAVEKLQHGIAGLQGNTTSINHKDLAERISNLNSEEVVKICNKVPEADKALRETIKGIKNDAQANWNAKRYSFTQEGIKLIRETGECPLCDKDWPVGKLKQYLLDRINAESTRQTKLDENSIFIIEKANILKTRIGQVTELVQPVIDSEVAKSSEVFNEGMQNLLDWRDALTKLIIALSEPMENFTDEAFTENDVKRLFVDETIYAELREFEKEIKQLFPEATPEQTAWDSLTKLIDRIEIVEKGEVALEHSLMVLYRATSLGQAYVSARDEILESLYDQIKVRFIELYRQMHGDDEKKFDASFIPREAGLNLEVDFYGKGLHPPHAMHSEGHQDSMGVCLFLALSEHLNSGLIDLVLLDDVVMSVDIGHRRAFCDVLIDNFPSRQFIITTHDTAWANQLRSVGLIPRKQMLKFSNWDVISGPVVHYEADMWMRIQADLDNDDVPAASARLRRGMEEFTRYVCDNLRAKVPYSLDDSGGLGEFLPAAFGRYKELLKKAKDAANSWNHSDVMEKLKKADEMAKEVYSRTGAEEWEINKAVHFNPWANFEKEDFLPVIKAFKDLYERVFSCPHEECQAVLKTTYDGARENGVRCKCGSVNWNLTEKEKKPSIGPKIL